MRDGRDVAASLLDRVPKHLARVAELFPLPPLEQLKREGFASGVEYLDSLRAAEKNAAEKTDDAPEANAETEASPKEATQKQGSLSALKFPHRASRAFAAPKTRPLATKLDDFLDYLFRSVWRTMGRKDAEYTLENAVEDESEGAEERLGAAGAFDRLGAPERRLLE